MEHAEAVKLIKDYGFAVLKHQNNWLGEAYEALLRALLATPAPLSDEPVAIYQMQLRGSDWADVEKRTFDDLPRIRRRIVYAAPPANPSDKQEPSEYWQRDPAYWATSDKQEAVAVPIANTEKQSFEFEAWFDREYPMDALGQRPKYQRSSVLDLMRAAYEAPLAQSAEQDRIDAEFISCLIHQARQRWQGEWTYTAEQVVEKARELAKGASK
jgi:hypothetical protein